MVDASGWNPKAAKDPLSFSPSLVPETNKPGQKIVIMLAEDNPADALLVSEAINLCHLSAALHVFEDGERAFRFIESAERDESAPCPALALLDLNLPRKNGIEILERIRQSPKCKYIPVVIVTSSDSPKDRSDTTRLGANRYFRKPTGYDDFLKLGQVLQDLIDEQHNK